MTPYTMKSACGQKTLDRAVSFREFAPRVGLTSRQFLIILMAKYISRGVSGSLVPNPGFEAYFTSVDGELMLSPTGANFFMMRYKEDAVAYSWMRRELCK